MSGPEVKQRLRSATEVALHRGVFGGPTIVVDREMFWGTDSLQDLELHLRGELPAFVDLWSAIPAAAVRKSQR